MSYKLKIKNLFEIKAWALFELPREPILSAILLKTIC